jgi:hypothetical protein
MHDGERGFDTGGTRACFFAGTYGTQRMEYILLSFACGNNEYGALLCKVTTGVVLVAVILEESILVLETAFSTQIADRSDPALEMK